MNKSHTLKNLSENIAVVGNCYFDEVYQISKFPKPDDKITAKDMTVTLGGSATNTSAGLVKLGIKPKLFSAIGDDISADQIIKELVFREIDPSFISRVKGKTGRTIILLDESKTSTKIGYPGVCRNLNQVFEETKPFVSQFDLIHLASLDLKTANYVLNNSKFNRISMDFGARTLSSTNEDIIEFLSKIDLAFLNRNVYKRLFPNSQLSSKDLSNIDLPCNFVLTAGERGLWAKIEDQIYFQDIFNVNVIDTTGAGDATAAIIIYGLLNKWDWQKILRFASIGAALKITTYGASNGHKSIEEITSVLNA